MEDVIASSIGGQGEYGEQQNSRRIPLEKISINVVRERPEEAVGVYTQDEYSISAGMGKYITVQANRGVRGDNLITASFNFASTFNIAFVSN